MSTGTSSFKNMAALLFGSGLVHCSLPALIQYDPSAGFCSLFTFKCNPGLGSNQTSSVSMVLRADHNKGR